MSHFRFLIGALQLSSASCRRRPDRGFATVNAMFLIVLIAAALAALAVVFATQARRSQAAPLEAQQRQLLLAGANLALGYLPPDPAAMPEAFKVTPVLPSVPTVSPAEMDLSLDLKPVDANRVEVTINATVKGQLARERVTFIREDNKWTATSTVMVSSGKAPAATRP